MTSIVGVAVFVFFALDLGTMNSLFGLLRQLAVILLLPGRSFWPYFAGAAILIIALLRIGWAEAVRARSGGKAIALGRAFFAIPMAVFGADHFISPGLIATLVPSWIPWHLFWVYLVGVALIASALSMVTKKQSVLAATLRSATLFSFVLLISGPESSLSVGALASALAQAEWPERRLRSLTVLVRYVIAIAAGVFGVEHFLRPEFVPDVPLRQPMPSWIPGHLFLAHVTGAALVAASLGMLFHRKARIAAIWLGIFVFAIVLFVYLPIAVSNLSDVANGLNYLGDSLAFSGTALLLAGALPVADCSEAISEERKECAARAGASA